MASINPLQSATEMVKRIRISNVLSSILWILPFSIAGLIIVSFGENELIQHFFMYVNGALFIVFIFSFLGILLFGDKNLLRSEEHVAQMRALEMIGDQRHEFRSIDNLPAGNNPELPDPATAEIPDLKDIKKLEEKHD